MLKNTLVASIVLLAAAVPQREAVARVGTGEEAGAPVPVEWDELAPPGASFQDPFLAMTYWEKDDLRTILKATPGTGDQALVTEAEEARERLALAGHDADDLLERRLVVMEQRRDRATGVSEHLLGREIALEGHVLPLRESDGRVDLFLFVPWVGACIHTPPPPPNQMIRVEIPEGIADEEAYYAVRLQGVLEHEPTISNLFLVDGQRFVESSYVLRQARISDRLTGTPRTEAPALVRIEGERP